jgi:hypothetical protein
MTTVFFREGCKMSLFVETLRKCNEKGKLFDIFLLRKIKTNHKPNKQFLSNAKKCDIIAARFVILCTKST